MIAQVTLRLGDSAAQRKEEFATVSVGQDGVEEFAWGQDFAFDYSKIGRRWTKIFSNNLRTTAKYIIIETMKQNVKSKSTYPIGNMPVLQTHGYKLQTST